MYMVMQLCKFVWIGPYAGSTMRSGENYYTEAINWPIIINYSFHIHLWLVNLLLLTS